MTDEHCSSLTEDEGGVHSCIRSPSHGHDHVCHCGRSWEDELTPDQKHVEEQLGVTVDWDRPMAYQGKAGCTDGRCRRMWNHDGPAEEQSCMGWHCAACDQPSSMYGHELPCPPPTEGFRLF